jgi:long-chain fatty acid transport protein
VFFGTSLRNEVEDPAMTHVGTKRILGATALLLASTSLASADISRADPSMRLLFEEVGPSGNYVELSFGFANPSANSNGLVPDPLPSYTLPGLGFVHRYNDNLTVALSYDTPFGAEVSYPGFPATPPFFGGNATVETQQLSLLGRYEFGNGFSVHAGLRALEVEGEIYTSVLPLQFHQLRGTSDIGFGYLVGGAYERPDIALRVALTYVSAIEVDFTNTFEQNIVPGGAPGTTNFSVEFPDSLNLEFQTGVAPGTLVFGSIHYEHWDGFNLTTPTVGQYVNFTSDTTTYQLGVGRQFTDNLSASISYTHRTDGTIPSDSSLAPTTGLDTITLGARYTMDAVTITGGITYGFPGDQFIANPFAPGGRVDFQDNEVFGAGVRIGFRF